MNTQWHIERNLEGAAIGYRAIVDGDGYTICNPSPMGEANARLIASAPDLLAALNDLLADAVRLGITDSEYSGSAIAARAAIAKAEGK